MQQADMGRARRTSSGTAWGTVFAIIVAIAIVAAVGYFVFAGAGDGYAPSSPYQSAAPGSAAPGSAAPATAAPSAPSYP